MPPAPPPLWRQQLTQTALVAPAAAAPPPSRAWKSVQKRTLAPLALAMLVSLSLNAHTHPLQQRTCALRGKTPQAVEDVSLGCHSHTHALTHNVTPFCCIPACSAPTGHPHAGWCVHAADHPRPTQTHLCRSQHTAPPTHTAAGWCPCACRVLSLCSGLHTMHMAKGQQQQGRRQGCNTGGCCCTQCGCSLHIAMQTQHAETS